MCFGLPAQLLSQKLISRRKKSTPDAATLALHAFNQLQWPQNIKFHRIYFHFFQNFTKAPQSNFTKSFRKCKLNQWCVALYANILVVSAIGVSLSGTVV